MTLYDIFLVFLFVSIERIYSTKCMWQNCILQQQVNLFFSHEIEIMWTNVA